MNLQSSHALRRQIWELLASDDKGAVLEAEGLAQLLPQPCSEPDELTSQCIFDVAFAMEGLGDDRCAMQLYKRVLEYPVVVTKYPASAWFRIGVCIARQGNLCEAVRCYRETLRLVENEAHLETIARYYLAVLLEADENYMDAADLYERVISALPHPDINPHRARLNRARCCWRVAREEEAIAVLTELTVKREEPESAEAWRLLAEIAESNREYLKARRAYQEVMGSPHVETSVRAGAAYRLAAITRELPRNLR